MDHHQADIYRKLKNPGAYSVTRQIHGLPFTFFIGLRVCNYYQLVAH